jgi:hypothetical protein
VGLIFLGAENLRRGHCCTFRRGHYWGPSHSIEVKDIDNITVEELNRLSLSDKWEKVNE